MAWLCPVPGRPVVTVPTTAPIPMPQIRRPLPEPTIPSDFTRPRWDASSHPANRLPLPMTDADREALVAPFRCFITQPVTPPPTFPRRTIEQARAEHRSKIEDAIREARVMRKRCSYTMAGRILRDSPENQRKMSAKERKLETIFDILKEKGGTYGVVAALAKKTGYSHQTLYRWRCQLRLNPAWRPYRCHYGQHRRAFTDLEELELVGRIKDEYLDKGLFYSDQDFIYDAQAFFAEVIQRPGDRASLNMNFQGVFLQFANLPGIFLTFFLSSGFFLTFFLTAGKFLPLLKSDSKNSYASNRPLPARI